MKNYAHIASRVLNTPLLLEAGYAKTFFGALAGRLGISELSDGRELIQPQGKLKVSLGQSQPVMRGWDDEGSSSAPDPFVIDRGIAMIPVSGTLVHKHGYLQPYSGMTGYDGIVRRVSMALANPAVKGVMLDMDTPGGEVAGCFDAASTLRRMADEAGKPLWSLCYDMNCSAGMALASSAHRRLITQTGVAGSVGVLMAHYSYEKHLEDEGIKVTLIHSGARKVDGNPYSNLSDEVLKRFTAETDALRQTFAELVSSMIGIDVEAVLQTEAGTYHGQAAVDIGFADELVNGNDAIDIFVDELSSQGRSTTRGAGNMKQTTEKGGAGAQAKAGQDSPAIEASAPSTAGTVETIKPAAVNQPTAADERARVGKILGSDEAKGRAELANHLALNTDLSVEQALSALAASPVSSVGATGTALDRAMSLEGAANVGADAGQSGAQSDTAKQIDTIASDYQAATGKRRKA